VKFVTADEIVNGSSAYLLPRTDYPLGSVIVPVGDNFWY